MSNAARWKLSSGTRWKIRSAQNLAKSHVPRPLRRQAVHLSFYNGRNFGDALSPIITEFALGEPVVEAHFAGADLSAIGSILDPLERWKNPRRPFAWGSGFIKEGPRWSGRPIRPVAVRGELSAERVAHLADEPLALGDPGLLVRRLYPELLHVAKRYPVSLIPHISETFDPAVREAQDALPALHVIDVRADPRQVLEEIAATSVVLSSSLHGLICADALEVPNVWVPLTGDLGGGDYKFRDYYSPFGREPNPVPFEAAVAEPEAHASLWRPLEGLDQVLDRLLAAFPREELLSLYRR